MREDGRALRLLFWMSAMRVGTFAVFFVEFIVLIVATRLVRG
jgi:hypothetical protein